MNSRKYIICEKCKKALTISGYKYHQYVDCLRQEIFKQYLFSVECENCNKIFDKKKEYNEHLKVCNNRQLKIERGEIRLEWD